MNNSTKRMVKELTICPTWNIPLSSIIKNKAFANLKPEHALLYLLLLLHEGDDLETIAQDGANYGYASAEPIDLWWEIAYNMPHLKGEVEAALNAWVENGLVDVIEGLIQLRAHVPYATEQDRFYHMTSRLNLFHRERAAQTEKKRLEGDEKPK